MSGASTTAPPNAGARLQAMYDRAAVGIATCDMSLRWLDANPRFCAMLGYTEAELRHRTVFSITHPDDQETDRAASERLLRGETDTYRTEKRYLRKDGHPVWVALTVTAIRATDGEAGYFVAFAEDISARKAADQKLRAFYDASPLLMALFELLPGGDIARFSQNEAADRFHGENAGLVLGTTARGRGMPEATLALWTNAATQALLGAPVTFEAASHAAASGPRLLSHTIVSLGFAGPGGGPAFAQVSEDITERRRAERALTESEARLQDLVATLNLASVFTRGLDQRIRFWSDGCERLYGYSAAEAVGQDFRDLLRAQFPIPFDQVQAALLRAGEWEGDVVHHRKDGTALTIAVRKVLGRTASGAPEAVMEDVADVTALREAQRALQTLNADLGERVRKEVAAREAAQRLLAHAQRMEALGQLAGGIAHDFNNVIQAVAGGASLIESRTQDPGLRRLTGMISDAARRGASVTRRLLTFARRGELRAEPFAVRPLLEGMVEVLQSALGGLITVKLQIDDNLPPLFADREQLETVLVNLATNARDAMRGGGTLTISAACVPDGLHDCPGVQLTVADTGEGMTPEVLARAAEPFFTTKPAGKGTGLGLSMTQGFAEQSGGQLAIESEPGAGTRIRLILPAHVESGGTHAAVAPPAKTEGPARVLLVDDEALVREVIGEQLADASYAVTQAPSGQAALAVLAQDPAFDLMITDFKMPGMDGLSLVSAARARLPALPCLILTGFAGDAAALAEGAGVALLSKPVSGAVLLERVATVLAGARNAGA